MKKNKPPERKAGIWLDQETAFIIHITGEEEPVIKRLKSGVESRVRYPGEVKVMARFGQAYLDDQEKKQRRQRNQREKFFKELIGLIHEDDYIYIFGPGKAKEGLNNAIEKDHSIKGKVVAIEAADKLTRNQMLQKVVTYFNDEAFRSFKKSLRKLKALN
jgi:hypothetical protein